MLYNWEKNLHALKVLRAVTRQYLICKQLVNISINIDKLCLNHLVFTSYYFYTNYALKGNIVAKKISKA